MDLQASTRALSYFLWCGWRGNFKWKYSICRMGGNRLLMIE